MNKSGCKIVSEGEGKVGLLAADGRVLLPCIYDSVLDFDDDGYIRFLKDGVYSTIDFEGRIAIPHSLGLTHLGVFHQGTARAARGEAWGLVDTAGNNVTPFEYKRINAFYNNSYRATRRDNVYGVLQPDGVFKKSGKKASKPLFKKIGTYHNDVAPAYTWQCKWIFIDREGNRVNNHEYTSIDPVLRFGAYVAMDAKGYVPVDYRGKPLTDDHFCDVLKFENGVSVCAKYKPDADEQPVANTYQSRTPLYGVIDSDGKMLHPMQYNELHWNSDKTKDCWYAEDDMFCYLLYIDGLWHAYDKTSAVRSVKPHYIPQSERDNYLSDHDITQRKQLSVLHTQSYVAFSKEIFFYELHKWTSFYVSSDILEVYYRDTDAPINVEEIYKPGMFLRAGSVMQVSSKLLRPAHRLRFLIASRGLYWNNENLLRANGMHVSLPYKESFIHYNTCFIVMGVQRYYGHLQVALLEMPYAILHIAQQQHVSLRGLEAVVKDEYEMITFAKADLQYKKWSEPTHGLSLSEQWCAETYRPIGLDSEFKLVPFEEQTEYSEIDPETKAAIDFLREKHEGYNELTLNKFIKEQHNAIRLVLGDITQLPVDAIVNADNTALDGGTSVSAAIHKAAGEELLTACQQHNGCRVGQSKLTSAFRLPCKKIVHTVPPIWHDGHHGEDRLLAQCYQSALHIARHKHFKSIAFPCLGTGSHDYPKERAAMIALRTILKFLRRSPYRGYITICCFSQDDADIYLRCFQAMQKYFNTLDIPAMDAEFFSRID